MEKIKKKNFSEALTSADAVLIYLSVFKFLLLLIFAGNYGLFRDEYYYVACSKHLAWGYVDQPPFSELMLLISRTIFGDSLFGIRIFAYLAGSVLIYVSGLIAREMGGNKYAQGLTGFTVLFCAVALGTTSYFSMNSFDLLFSALMFYYLVKLLKSGDAKYWYVIGLICGIGLMNKLTFLFLGFGLVVGLLLTDNRRFLFRKELWVGGAIAFLIFLPNIIWQIVNHFPTIEFMDNATKYKNMSMSILEFSKNAAFELNPGLTFIILIALYYLFFNKSFKKFRLIGWLFISVFLVFVFNNGKPYYMGVLYPVMLAAGAVGVQRIIEKYSWRWLKPVVIVIVIPFVFLVTPFAIPVLPVDTFVKYSETLGLKPGVGERSTQGILPQFFGDRYGWEEMAKQVGEVYNQLSGEEKKNVLVFGQNYGEAGAVDFYADKYNLPPAISGHNNYWIWGYPPDRSGEVMIVIGSSYEDNKEFFEEVELAAQHRNKYCMPYENVDIFICRKPKMPLSELWKRVKVFI